MIEHNIDPVLFSIFGLEIRYYGLVYALGLIIIYYFLTYLTKKGDIPNFEPKNVETFVIGLIVMILVGARLFHVFVYSPSNYILNPIDIIKIWEGGLSFHGALTFAALWIWIYSKAKKISFLRLTDALVVPIAFLLGLGRLANFANGELRGIPTNSSLGVIYQDENFARWPTQLFESAKNFFIFGVLTAMLLLRNVVMRKYIPGLYTAIFLISYGAIRFMIEFLKEGRDVLLNLNTGQLLSLATVVVGIGVLWWRQRFKNKQTKK